MSETYNNPVALEDRAQAEERLFSPSAGRNKAVIAENLAALLPQNAHVLEIGSGTGEQGIETLLARPDLSWQFSDLDPDSRASQAAWIAHEGLTLPAPKEIDPSQSGWSDALAPFDVLFSSNVIHIAPIAVLQGLAAGAGQHLPTGGLAILYGPFLFGDDSAPSNLEFDRSLRSRNSEWGVRESAMVKEIFAKAGLGLREQRALPKNNHILVFARG